MSDIILNGVSIAELKKQKELIQKDAAEFIAKHIEEATELIKSIVDSEEDGLSDEQIQTAAARAKDILENVQVVSGVSGVAFYLPYYEEWGYADERPYTSRPYTSQLDDTGLVSYRNHDDVYALHSLLESMEYDSKNWHSSQC